jgi:hypothetical protein
MRPLPYAMEAYQEAWCSQDEWWVEVSDAAATARFSNHPGQRVNSPNAPIKTLSLELVLFSTEA